MAGHGVARDHGVQQPPRARVEERGGDAQGAGAGDVLLILEIVPAFEQDDEQVLADLRASAELWQAALTERGMR